MGLNVAGDDDDELPAKDVGRQLRLKQGMPLIWHAMGANRYPGTAWVVISTQLLSEIFINKE